MKVRYGGVSFRSLCVVCNSKLSGANYVNDYKAFSHRAKEIVGRCIDDSYILMPFRLRPLRVIKQIICMFASVNRPLFYKNHPELAHFARELDERRLPPEYMLFGYYARGPALRYQEFFCKGNPLTGEVISFSEMAYRPLGFALSYKSGPPHIAMQDISYFGNFSPDEEVELWLRLPLFYILSNVPGNYITPSELTKNLSGPSEEHTPPINLNPKNMLSIMHDTNRRMNRLFRHKK